MNVTFVVAFQLLACQLSRRDMSEIHIWVRIEEVNESLACVPTGAYESYLCGLRV